MIESGAYKQKPIPGSTRKLASVGSIRGSSLHPTSLRSRPLRVGQPRGVSRRRRGFKAEPKVKAEKGVKAEEKVKAEFSLKPPRPASGEVSTPKRFAVTRQRVRELGKEPSRKKTWKT